MKRNEVACPYCGTYVFLDENSEGVLCEFCEHMVLPPKEEPELTQKSSSESLSPELRAQAEAILGVKKEESDPSTTKTEIDILFDKALEKAKSEYSVQKLKSPKTWGIFAIICVIALIITIIMMVSLTRYLNSFNNSHMSKVFDVEVIEEGDN